MDPDKLGNVQQKISCIYETKVIEEPSPKRAHQPFKVVASSDLKSTALEAKIETAVATEKLDGTCAYIAEYCDKPWLWARLDRKPNKNADKKFKKYQTALRIWEVNGKINEKPSNFMWDVKSDFKDVPTDWIPAAGVSKQDGLLVPDENGHIPGWVPIDPSSKQHVWHLSTVDLDAGLALVLRPGNAVDSLEITIVLLNDLIGSTLELIGTNVNGNPYRLGCKKNPLHLLVRHGSIPLKTNPPLEYEQLRDWLVHSADGAIEGVVWHCENGKLFKIHRHHFDLPWPIENLSVTRYCIVNNVELTKYNMGYADNIQTILKLGKEKGTIYENLTMILQNQH